MGERMSLDATGFRGALAAALLLAAATPAAAQQETQNQQTLNEPPNTVGPTERMQSHSAWHLSRTVSGHVGRVLTGKPQASGTAQSSLPAATMRETPAGASDGAGPVASATGGPPLWSVWVGPNVTWSDQDDPVAGNEGHMLTTYAGLDRRVLGRGVIGLIGGFETADFDTALLGGRLETEGFGVGAYGGYAVTDVIVVDAMALYTWVDNDFADRLRSASYDSERLQLAANVTAYLREERLSFRPKLGVAWSLDEQEAYRDTLRIPSPETEVETFSVSAGAQVGYTFFLDGGRTIEPWLGAAAVFEDSSSDPSPAAGSDELEQFDVRLSAGLNAQLAERLSFTLNADVSGLARPDHDAVTVGAQLSLQF